MTPAPLLRRLIAASYDGLLLLGIWMVALLIDIVIRDQFGASRDLAALRAYVFLIGLAFFGWFWTHGGQTLGMRVWRLQVVSASGGPLRWIDAALRYALTLVCWGIALTPAMAQLPQVSSHPQAGLVSIITAALGALALLLMWRDPQRRAPQDWFSRTRMILLEKP
jgi:uncharacterized RDD family membrane protein YckC